MSVGSVLERSGNVRDMRELDPVGKVELWDEITPEMIKPFLFIYPVEATILLQDFDISDPDINDTLKHYKNEVKTSDPSKIELDLTALPFNSFLGKSTAVRLVERKMNEDLGKGLDEAYKVLSNESEEFKNDHLDINFYVDYLLNFSINYPSQDLSESLNLIKNLIPPYLVEWSKEDIVYKEYILKQLAFIKIIDRDLFNNLNFDYSKIYKSLMAQVEGKFTDGFISDIIRPLAYLKVLAAKEARLGERGIELELPAKAINSPVITFPEIGRFDV